MRYQKFAEREVSILGMLFNQGSADRKALSKELFIPITSIDSLLASLESKGLISLSKIPTKAENGHDSHSVIVNLADAQKAQLEIEDTEEAGTRLKVAYGILERVEWTFTKELARTPLKAAEVGRELGIAESKARKLIKAAQQSQE